MTRFPDLFAALAAPFEAREVRTRNQGTLQIQYITARTAMNRLDSILGPENWWDEYIPGENSVLCRLTVRIADPDAAESRGWLTITKSDAGGYAGMADQGDDDKSGFSDAFKRAAVKFGVGRYLYRDGVPDFAADRPATAAAPPKIHEPEGPPAHAPANPKVPASGRALFAWTREMETKHEIVLLKYLNGWAKLQEFPGRMVDWDHGQVAAGYAEACRKLHAISA
jgi:hypothetical protein